jgi:hypothetical protein
MILAFPAAATFLLLSGGGSHKAPAPLQTEVKDRAPATDRRTQTVTHAQGCTEGESGSMSRQSNRREEPGGEFVSPAKREYFVCGPKLPLGCNNQPGGGT